MESHKQLLADQIVLLQEIEEWLSGAEGHSRTSAQVSEDAQELIKTQRRLAILQTYYNSLYA